MSAPQTVAPTPFADALAIAEHWRAAGELQTALAWRHRGADQLKARGRFDEARALWLEVAEASLDAAQALRARLELAACDLFHDLARGEAALVAVQACERVQPFAPRFGDPAERMRLERATQCAALRHAPISCLSWAGIRSAR